MTSSREATKATLFGKVSSAIRQNSNLSFGVAILGVFVLVILVAPVLSTIDPQVISTGQRLRPPSWQHWFGTDRLGRDIYSRVAFGTSASLAVGIIVALLSCVLGTFIGLIAGYFRWLDTLIMRFLDGIMAIPGIMLAIAAISVAGASITTVVLAMTVNELPRVARLIRGATLSIREEPFVEAAIVLGSRPWFIVARHILPGILAPLAVLGTYVAANAMLLEATLSFLGCGLPPDIPTWGNIMADGRILFRIAPWIILIPGVTLAVAVLAINMLGDGLRDYLDPSTAKAMR